MLAAGVLGLLGAAVVHGCGLEPINDTPANMAGSAGAAAGTAGHAGRGGTSGHAGKAGGAGTKASPPPAPAEFRWPSTFPADFALFGDESRWVQGPSIGRDDECVVYEARDPGTILPPIAWTSVAEGVDTTDPRRGLKYGVQAEIGADLAGGMRAATLRLIVADTDTPPGADREGSDAYELRLSTNLTIGGALGVVSERYVFSTKFFRPCGLGVSISSPRDLSVTMSPRRAVDDPAPPAGDGHQTFLAFERSGDPPGTWYPWPSGLPETFTSATVGPAPRKLLAVDSSSPTVTDWGDTHFTLLDTTGQDIYAYDLMTYGDKAVWLETLHDRDRIRSYTKEGGVQTEVDGGPGFVRRITYDGERYSGIIQDMPEADFWDETGHIAMWTKDPDTGKIRLGPSLMNKPASARKLQTAGNWGVVFIRTRTEVDGKLVAITPTGESWVVLVVNLTTWATYRVPATPGRWVVERGFGIDDDYVYTALRDGSNDSTTTNEVRRYSLAKITQWGIPWVAP
jgi:hypothetical protein